MNANKNFINTNWIDDDDAPELTEAFFEQADEYQNGVLIKHGLSSKEAVNLDCDIITIFKATGENWQSRMNEVLREWVTNHPNLVSQ